MQRLGGVMLCAFLACTANAQPFLFRPDFFLVTLNDSTVTDNPFAGGVNGPKVQFVDIDHDGDADLFVLDVVGSLSFYENVGDERNARWALRTNDFQSLHVTRWFRFVDIDGDGDFDLFSGGSNATVLFYLNSGTTAAPVFTSTATTVRDSSGITVQSEDQCYPTFADIDNDGDFDFLAGSSIGTITLYENIGTRTQPQWKFRTSEWQGIKIISPASPGTSDPHIMHGANSLTFTDLDHDGNQDLFFGDLFTKGLLFFHNNSIDGGRTAKMHVDSLSYPYNADSVRTTGFNAAAMCDIDGDGLDDLFVGHLLGTRQSFFFFHNDGTSSIPAHHLRTREYLSMIDVGSDAKIAFGDLTGDSLNDLVVCSQQGFVQLFVNAGSNTHPAFVRVSDSLVVLFNQQNLAPAIVDLDDDGKNDLVIGTAAGTMYWYRNVSTPDSFRFVRGDQSVLSQIHVGQNATPAFMDLDGDGDMDLLVGHADGRLGYYRNDGSRSSPLFVPANDFYDSITVGGTQPFNSVPSFVDVDSDGRVDLLIGRSDGTIRYYRNDGISSAPHFSFVADTFAGIIVQGNAAPAMIDIDHDGDLDLFVGTRLGGIQAFENRRTVGVDSKAAQPSTFQSVVWPNPCCDVLHMNFPELVAGSEISVVDVLGRTVSHSPLSLESPVQTIPLHGIPSGWYVAMVRGPHGIFSTSFFHWQ